MEPVSVMRQTMQGETRERVCDKENLYDIRLEDIPREVLLKYGLIIDEEEDAEEIRLGEASEEEREDRLVIDESKESREGKDHGDLVNNQFRLLAQSIHSCSYKKCRLRLSSAEQKRAHELLHCSICSELQPDLQVLSVYLRLKGQVRTKSCWLFCECM